MDSSVLYEVISYRKRIQECHSLSAKTLNCMKFVLPTIKLCEWRNLIAGTIKGLLVATNSTFLGVRIIRLGEPESSGWQ